MASVQIRRVEKFFGAAHIIRGVDLDIQDGEFVVLVGPSGCGKSTLLRMIAGLEEISRRRDRDRRHAWSTTCRRKDRDIAMVFQNYALYPHMTVRENMAFSLQAGAGAARPRSSERVSRRPRILGLGRCSTAIRASSRAASGSASRWAAPSCATRRCSCSTSRCPTSTPSCACRCAPRSRSCTSALKTTTVYVTHDQIEAMTMADRIVVMQRRRASSRSARRSSSTTGPPTCSSPASSARPR